MEQCNKIIDSFNNAELNTMKYPIICIYKNPKDFPNKFNLTCSLFANLFSWDSSILFKYQSNASSGFSLKGVHSGKLFFR